jgi:hypothetical protein
MTDERTEPPYELEWVSPFMREIQKDYVMYDREFDEFHPIVFSEGDYIMDEGEEEEETIDFQEVCLWNGEALETIIDDHVYPKYHEALEVFERLSEKIPHDKEGIKILMFRHGDRDWGTACTIEPSVVVNKLGYGIFVRKDLLEGSKVYKLPELTMVIENE